MKRILGGRYARRGRRQVFMPLATILLLVMVCLLVGSPSQAGKRIVPVRVPGQGSGGCITEVHIRVYQLESGQITPYASQPVQVTFCALHDDLQYWPYLDIPDAVTDQYGGINVLAVWSGTNIIRIAAPGFVAWCQEQVLNCTGISEVIVVLTPGTGGCISCMPD